MTAPGAPRTAFVLGGGGVLGAVEVGMLQALLEAGVRPDLVLGTSIGALNGAFVAQDPHPRMLTRLTDLWRSAATEGREVYGDGPVRTVRRALATGTHLWSAGPLRQRLADELGAVHLEELVVPFQVCAANIERAAEHWFETGPVVEAVVASAAVPGLLPPARVDGEHYLDGGIVNSIPLGRAVQLGATRVFVLQVGRIDRPLTPPRRPWEVARVSFEIARRHRFHRELAEVTDPERPGGAVEVHVLPARGTSGRDDTIFATRDFSGVERRIESTYDACREYLAQHLPDPAGAP
ncbi:patatin-like phospholipase family protein [Nocardioides nanhaiensis]|uniref:Patatin-like phospholipase family protein n=1 Tax=Nocardioides nanhaiensis TaxID=1476871 RepID=A0ABP8WEA9_9ACTN